MAYLCGEIQNDMETNQNLFMILLQLLGSLGLLIYGMRMMSEALQKMAGPQLRHILAKMTTNRLTGMLTGTLVTCAVQSSSATTVMTVSFVSAGLLTLAQAISVIMGANIGTTLTAWIMSLGYNVNLTNVVYPSFLLGIILIYKKCHRYVGDFLLAKDSEEDVLRGFGLGADDYVSKPFSLREVLARVKAVLNRKPSSAPAPKAELQFEGLVVNVINKTICIDGQPVTVTRTEFELLKLLLEYRGQVFSRQQLLDSVWPQDVIVTERTVDVNIARLRKKLGRYGACLVSRTGFGYVFDVSKPLTLFS